MESMDSLSHIIQIEYYLVNNIHLQESPYLERVQSMDYMIQDKIQKYRKEEDKNMCFVSSLIKSKIEKEQQNLYPSCQLMISSRSKPYLINSPLQFNISHHSQCVCCITSTTLCVGIDVYGMNIKQPISLFSSFISLMKSNLHENEERFLSIFNSPISQYQSFIQFWILKEAFLKAIGVGIGDERFPLNSLDFSNSIYSSSQYSIYEGYYKNMLLEGWVFVTIMLDDIHILGIACGPKQEKIENDKIVNCNKLEISLDSIILENHVIYKANGNCTIHITYSDISMLL